MTNDQQTILDLLDEYNRLQSALEKISKGPYSETVTGYNDYATTIAREVLGVE